MKELLTIGGLKATDRTLLTFSDDYRVPDLLPYYKAYKVSSGYNNKTKKHEKSKLKPITRLKGIDKTVVVDKILKQNVNNCLRACTLAIIRETNKLGSSKACFITIYFSPEYARKLSLKDNPVGEYSDVIKKRFNAFGIEDFYCVFEQGAAKNNSNDKYAGIHVHIVALMVNLNFEAPLRKILRNPKEVLIDINESTASSAVKIQYGYHLQIRKKHHFDSSKSMIPYFAENNPQTLWREANKKETENGVLFIHKELTDINVGLADYLSKGLNSPVFENSKSNFYKSRTLTKKMNALVEERLTLLELDN